MAEENNNHITQGRRGLLKKRYITPDGTMGEVVTHRINADPLTIMLLSLHNTTKYIVDVKTTIADGDNTHYMRMLPDHMAVFLCTNNIVWSAEHHGLAMVTKTMTTIQSRPVNNVNTVPFKLVKIQLDVHKLHDIAMARIVDMMDSRERAMATRLPQPLKEQLMKFIDQKNNSSYLLKWNTIGLHRQDSNNTEISAPFAFPICCYKTQSDEAAQDRHVCGGDHVLNLQLDAEGVDVGVDVGDDANLYKLKEMIKRLVRIY